MLRNEKIKDVLFMIWISVVAWAVTAVGMTWWQTRGLFASMERSPLQEACIRVSDDNKSKISIFMDHEVAFTKLPMKACIWLVAIVVAAASIGYLTFDNTSHFLDNTKLLIGFSCIASVALVDYKRHVIPNIIPTIMASARTAIFAIEIFLHRDDAAISGLASIVAGVAILAVLSIIYKLMRGGFGLGDLKLLSALGFLCGPYAVLSIVMFALIICAIVSVFFILIKKKTMRDVLPFGPFILLGSIVTLITAAY